jgi:gas vesicle protein
MARRNISGNRKRGSGGQRSSSQGWQWSASSSPTLFGTVLGIAGGIGVGAAAMYLLDPNQGERRRHQLAERASQTVHGAWDTVSERAAEAGEKLASALPLIRVSETAASAAEKTDQARSAGRAWIEAARARLSDKVAAMNPFERHRVAPAAVAATSAGLTALAIGATAMYFFDPDRGRARRAWVGQKLSRARNETGRFLRATGRHLANKGQGYYYETRSAAEQAVGSAVSKFGGSPEAPTSSQESAVPSI